MRSIAVVCIRAVAAYLILSCVTLLSVMLPTLLVMPSSVGVLPTPFVGPTVMIIVGFAMLVFSKKLAALLVAGIPTPDPGAVDAQALLRIGTLVLGLYMLAMAMPQLAGALWQYFALGNLDAAAELGDQIQQQNALGFLIASLAKLAIGGLLVGMSKPISALWRKPPVSAA